LGDANWLHGAATISIGDLNGDRIGIAIPADWAETLVSEENGSATYPSARPTSHVAANPDDELLDRHPPVVCIDAPDVAAHLAKQFPEWEVLLLPTKDDLRTVLDEGLRPTVLIVRVRAGEDALLDELSKLKNEPRMRGCPIMILLENAVERTVMRCGKLGLVNVLPSTVDPDVVRRRLTPKLRPPEPVD
jgi:hypothetical protein